MDRGGESAGGALAATLELFDLGVQLMRQNLRRRHPSATDEEIAGFLRVWLEQRPGAEHGDCTGRPANPGRIG